MALQGDVRGQFASLAGAGAEPAVWEAPLGPRAVTAPAQTLPLPPAQVKAQYDAARTRQRDTL